MTPIKDSTYLVSCHIIKENFLYFAVSLFEAAEDKNGIRRKSKNGERGEVEINSYIEIYRNITNIKDVLKFYSISKDNKIGT